MPKFTVEFKGSTFAQTTVEAEDENEAIELAFAEGGFPDLCGQCSGWGKGYTLSIPDDSACWEPVSVTDEAGTELLREEGGRPTDRRGGDPS